MYRLILSLSLITQTFAKTQEEVNIDSLNSNKNPKNEVASIEFSTGLGIWNAVNLNSSIIINKYIGIEGYVGSSLIINTANIYIIGNIPLENSYFRMGFGPTIFNIGYHGTSNYEGYGVFLRYSKKTSDHSNWAYYGEFGFDIAKKINTYYNMNNTNDNSFLMKRIVLGFNYKIPLMLN